MRTRLAISGLVLMTSAAVLVTIVFDSTARADLTPTERRRLTDVTVSGEVIDVQETTTSTHRRFNFTLRVTAIRGRLRQRLRGVRQATMQHLCHTGSVAEARGFTRCADTVGQLPTVGMPQTLILHWTSEAGEWGGWSEVTDTISLWTYGVQFQLRCIMPRRR